MAQVLRSTQNLVISLVVLQRTVTKCTRIKLKRTYISNCTANLLFNLVTSRCRCCQRSLLKLPSVGFQIVNRFVLLQF